MLYWKKSMKPEKNAISVLKRLMTLNGFNADLLIKKLGIKFNKDDIRVIAENKEKYISFNVKTNVMLAGVIDIDGK